MARVADSPAQLMEPVDPAQAWCHAAAEGGLPKSRDRSKLARYGNAFKGILYINHGAGRTARHFVWGRSGPGLKVLSLLFIGIRNNA